MCAIDAPYVSRWDGGGLWAESSAAEGGTSCLDTSVQRAEHNSRW